jgi:hypothetical protein
LGLHARKPVIQCIQELYISSLMIEGCRIPATFKALGSAFCRVDLMRNRVFNLVLRKPVYAQDVLLLAANPMLWRRFQVSLTQEFDAPDELATPNLTHSF